MMFKNWECTRHQQNWILFDPWMLIDADWLVLDCQHLTSEKKNMNLTNKKAKPSFLCFEKQKQ